MNLGALVLTRKATQPVVGFRSVRCAARLRWKWMTLAGSTESSGASGLASACGSCRLRRLAARLASCWLASFCLLRASRRSARSPAARASRLRAALRHAGWSSTSAHSFPLPAMQALSAERASARGPEPRFCPPSAGSCGRASMHLCRSPSRPEPCTQEDRSSGSRDAPDSADDSVERLRSSELALPPDTGTVSRLCRRRFSARSAAGSGPGFEAGAGGVTSTPPSATLAMNCLSHSSEAPPRPYNLEAVPRKTVSRVVRPSLARMRSMHASKSCPFTSLSPMPTSWSLTLRPP
mmetsp:Transcript_113166/g.365630  ORF Transcript_113166/g.365630 Transcript_113166/m.365630 type:complete len:294 (-) Transcript_113166:1399-2280(-)